MTLECRDYVLADTDQEMDRQDAKWGPDRDLDDGMWALVLGEEVGEVAKAVLEHDPDNLEVELIQVAAVALQWVLCLRSRVDKQT